MEDKIINEEQNESLIQADSSREVKEEAKKNFFQILLGYLKGILWDFVQSFKYNNMKLAGLLIIIPGAIFGFFLYYHALVVRQVVFISTLGSNYYGTPDISGLLLFIQDLLTYCAASFGVKSRCGSFETSYLFCLIGRNFKSVKFFNNRIRSLDIIRIHRCQELMKQALKLFVF